MDRHRPFTLQQYQASKSRVSSSQSCCRWPRSRGIWSEVEEWWKRNMNICVQGWVGECQMMSSNYPFSSPMVELVNAIWALSKGFRIYQNVRMDRIVVRRQECQERTLEDWWEPPCAAMPAHLQGCFPFSYWRLMFLEALAMVCLVTRILFPAPHIVASSIINLAWFSGLWLSDLPLIITLLVLIYFATAKETSMPA